MKYNSTIKKGVDWDNIFISQYPRIFKQNKTEFNSTIDTLLSKVVIPLKNKDTNNEKDYALIDNSWFYDSLYINKDISNQLNFIFKNYSFTDNNFVSNNSIGNLIFNEKKDNDYYCPSQSIRMLSLARYWNIINYFYVYKNYMDIKWDDVLLNIISEFKNADNEIVYHKSVQKLSSFLNDCHSTVRSKILDKKIKGRLVPNFRLKMINDTFVVSKFRVPEYSHYGLQISDIILAIDSVEIKTKYNNLKQFFRGANKLTEQRVINPYLLALAKDKIHLTYLRNHKIIQLKDYSVFSLINYILSQKQDFFISTYSDVEKPGAIRLHNGYKIGSNKKSIYGGQIFILVNEHTQSMAEFLVMALQTAPNVTVVGSQTGGSDGNVTKFSFPGKIRSVFIGVGIYYPDTTQTQRKGIKIDYEVNQTIKGIQAQQDEILNFTINLIKKNQSK